MSCLISIIVATLNSADTLQRCLDSIAGQTYAEKEIIVIDGNSSDDTLPIIERNSGFINFWLSEPDNGIYNAFNKGIAAANGDWIIFLGADDYLWDKRVLSNVATELQDAGSNYLVAYGKVAVVRIDKQPVEIVGEDWPDIRSRFRQKMALPHQGVFQHKSLFNKVGLFDENYKILGDYDLLLRELLNNDALFLGDIIISAVQHGGTSNNPDNRSLFIRESIKVRQAHNISFLSFNWIALILRSLLRISLLRLFGTQISNQTADLYRIMTGKPRIWSKHKLDK